MSDSVPFFDSVPIVAQLKSLVQVIGRDVEGARRTQENFSRTCILVSQARSAVELAIGDKYAARQTQLIFLRVGLRNGNAFLNGVPVVGHIKGGIHYALDDKSGFADAMKASSRTVGVIAGAVGGALVGGPVGAVTGGMGGGVAVDTLSTGIESAISRRFSPSGTLALVTNLARNPTDPGAVFDAAGGLMLTVTLDGVGGALVGQGARLVAANTVPSAAVASVSALDTVGLAMRIGSGVGSSTLAHFNQRDGRIRWRLTELNLMCRKGCGWYGTPQRNGLCGKCWRLNEISRKQAHSSLLKFEKFEQKRRRIVNRRKETLKEAFGIESDTNGPYQNRLRVIKQSHHRLNDEKFEIFLCDLPTALATEISKVVEETIDTIFEMQQNSTDDLSERVQLLYLKVSEIIRKNSETDTSDKGENNIVEEDILDRVEHDVEEEEQLANNEWITSLKWVKSEFATQETTQFLGLIERAGQELAELNNVRSAVDKLACILRCFACLTSAAIENRGACSADDLFPVTVYMILKENPDSLQANLDFIAKFGQNYQVSMGDSGYAYTTLDAAFTFVKSLNREILDIHPDDWDTHMADN